MTFKDPAKGKDGLVFVTKKFDSNHTDLASMCEWIVSDVNYPSMTNPSVAGQYRHGGILHDWT